VKELKGTSWGCSKKARLLLHENGLLRVKSNTPIEFRKWVNLMENEMVRTVMFDHAKELVADR